MEIKLLVTKNFKDTKHDVKRRKKQIFIEDDKDRAKTLIDANVVNLISITKEEPQFNADKANGKQLEEFAEQNGIDLSKATLVKEKREIVKQWMTNS